MPSSLRVAAFLFALVKAETPSPGGRSGGPSQNNGHNSQSHKSAVTNLMESAKTFLKNGATSDVVEFADATLTEISSVVIPAIENESITDQAFIMTLHSRFQDILNTLTTENLEVFQLNAEEQTATVMHQTCRSTNLGGEASEEHKCVEKRVCEMSAYRLWTEWVTEEEELRQIHASIDGHFCPPGSNGTLHSFRVASVPWMESYMAQKSRVDAAELAYDVHIPTCVTTHSNLDEKSAICNANQVDLEEKACAHEAKINEVLTAYYNDWAQAESAYNCAVEEIMELERDRHREFITLQVVNCLLERVHEQNGRPCDSETGEVDDQVSHCEQVHSLSVCDPVEGNTILCLNYPPVPAVPPFCPARDQVVGECLPVSQPAPCTDVWDREQYDSLLTTDGENLRAWPTAEYSETNPGCNAWPSCSGCAPLVAPVTPIIDSCPGYTADGCAASGQDIPLTFVRNVEGIADLRCCSIDGEICATNMQSGHEFLRTGSINTDNCITGVTYQEAMSVCHANGMRICNLDEVEACCSTGCGSDSAAVWIDINSDQIGTHHLNSHAEINAQ